ncbi:MAG: TlpA family protein disulfide reductase [Oscillospiraceae bacterium]|nr:TlpA family protein disulfide reductase [Oscillospiraceae bacterium]
MKRFFSLLLACMLIFGVASHAFAEEVENTLDLSPAGMTLQIPEEFLHTEGVLMPDGGYEIDEGIYFTEYLYFATTWEEYVAIANNADLTDEEYDAFLQKINVPFMLLGIDGSRPFSAINDLFGGQLKEDCAEVIAEEDGFTHYLYLDPAENDAFAATLAAPFAEDYQAVLDAVPKFVEASKFYTPVSLYAGLVGNEVSFHTTDMAGNSVDSKDLFAANAVTMVNIWTSWCPPCIGELPELEKINSRLNEIGCGVVGLLYDGDDSEALKTAEKLIADNGVTYPVILPFDTVDQLFQLEAFPTTYFVDSNGKILCEPLVGAYVDQYEATVQSLLAAE